MHINFNTEYSKINLKTNSPKVLISSSYIIRRYSCSGIRVPLCFQLCECVFFSQLAAQVLDDLDDEDIGFGLVDEKKGSVVAKKLGKYAQK